MEFVALKKHLKSEPPKPCYFCYGDDEYVISRAVALISELAKEPKPFNLVDKEFSSVRDLIDEAMQLPMMSDYRVVVARGKIDASGIEEYLKKPNVSTVLVFASFIPHDAWNKSSEPACPKGATPVDCNRIALEYARGFMRNIAKTTNATIDDSAASVLYSLCCGYMMRISSEIQKLALLKAGGTVSVDDVKREVKPETEFVVFELTDCIVKGDAARALAVVDGMAKNNDLVAAFTLLYNRFKRMFIAAVDEGGLAALGVKPYMATRLKTEAAAFGKARLKKMLDALADADYAYKTGAVSQYDAMCSFVAEAVAGGR